MFFVNQTFFTIVLILGANSQVLVAPTMIAVTAQKNEISAKDWLSKYEQNRRKHKIFQN